MSLNKDYYREMFADILVDVGETRDARQMILDAFVEALEEWASYHTKSATQYQEMIEMLPHAARYRKVSD